MKDKLEEFLQENSRIFHSEADLQHSLAMYLESELENSDIRLEREFLQDEKGKRSYLDILVISNDSKIPIELKYKTKGLETKIDGESYNLKNQQAENKNRRAVVEDIHRVEKYVEDHGEKGYVVFLTNNGLCWNGDRARKEHPQDEDFRLHEGKELEGTLKWKGSKDPEPISLNGTYNLSWESYNYQNQPDRKEAEFKYLLIEVT
ncbi:MAG: hypothetical protein ABEJ95_01555 [Candidatus Nanohalobium sp.]